MFPGKPLPRTLDCSKVGEVGSLPSHCGVVHVGQVVSFGIFQKSASHLLPDGWVELKISACRCHFRTFQLELDTLVTKNLVIGSVVKKLQVFEVGRISKFLKLHFGFLSFFSGFYP